MRDVFRRICGASPPGSFNPHGRSSPHGRPRPPPIPAAVFPQGLRFQRASVHPLLGDHARLRPDLPALPRRGPAAPEPDPAQPPPKPDLIDQVADLRPSCSCSPAATRCCATTSSTSSEYSAKQHGLHTSLSPSATPLLLRTDFHALKEAGIQRLSLSLEAPPAKPTTPSAGCRTPSTAPSSPRTRPRGRHPLQINTTIHKGNSRVRGLLRTDAPIPARPCGRCS